jgi:hypothetical protein
MEWIHCPLRPHALACGYRAIAQQGYTILLGRPMCLEAMAAFRAHCGFLLLIRFRDGVSIFSQIYKPVRSDQLAMEIATIIFYVILFLLAFMIARIILKIMRGY